MITLNVRCRECGTDLEGEIIQIASMTYIDVEVCEACLDKAEERGRDNSTSYDDGHQEGYDSGYEDGKEKGYDEGYNVGHEDGEREALGSEKMPD